MADLRGQVINGYELRALIGHGGMGNVYYAIHRQSGQAVAVKCFKPELAATNAELLERFEREGEILRQLDHPNIVKVLETFNDNDQHFIVMEYVSGGSLRTLLDKTPKLPIERVLMITLDLADALTRAHRLNIIHRDIKPANVLLAEDGTPRLTDFGVAYLSHKPRVTKADSVMGTLDYLSPEALNSEEVDARMDIWAFGVVIFEMLAGRRPFDERTAAATAVAIIQKPFPDLEVLRPDAPVALVDLVYRMLEKDRQARISSVRFVGAELEAISKGTDIILPVSHRIADDGKPVFGTPTSITGVSKHNLPAQTTPFVGRLAELTEVTRLLADPAIRLITILGLGGMGKSRLALEVASAQIARYPQGVYFVSLASLNSIDQLIASIAQAVNFNFYQSENLKQQLLDYFREKDVLLVMDSFEHLLDGAVLIGDLLRYAPRVTVLATSREKLNIYGETVFMIGGMAVPDRHTLSSTPQFDAVKLFVQSARRAQPHFELKPDDYKCIAKICQLVQGMPLGIELAAAWVEMLSLHEIAEEIGQGLDFLETEESGIPERHRSIRAVFDYTWNCLDDTEQALMKMLSVFQGGCTRKAAQTVTGASLQKLTSLVNRSLLRRNPDGRYEMQQLLRQSIEERLNESPDENYQAHAKHALYYAEMLDEREIPLRGADQKAVLSEITADRENIRAAWFWGVEHKQAEIIGKALHSLYTYFLVQERGREAEQNFESAAQSLRAEQNRYVLGRVLARQGWLTTIKKAEALFRESIDLLRPFNVPDELAFALLGMGSTLLRREHDQAQHYLEEGLALYQSVGNRWGERIALFWLHFWASAQGQHNQAKQFLLTSLEIAEDISDNLGAMMCHQELGNIARGQGEYEEANQHYRGSLAIAREIGLRGDSARALRSLGNVARAMSQYAKAEQLLNESMLIYKELGNWPRIARVLYEIGEIACMQERYAEAEAIFENSLRINEELCCDPDPDPDDNGDQDYQERLFQEASRQEGQVYALTGLGGAARCLKKFDNAQHYLYRALQTATNTGTIPVIHIALIAIAELLAATADQQRSAELSAFIAQNADWQETKDRAQRLLADLQVVMPSSVFTASVEHGSKIELETVVAALLDEGV